MIDFRKATEKRQEELTQLLDEQGADAAIDGDVAEYCLVAQRMLVNGYFMASEIFRKHPNFKTEKHGAIANKARKLMGWPTIGDAVNASSNNTNPVYLYAGATLQDAINIAQEVNLAYTMRSWTIPPPESWLKTQWGEGNDESHV